MVNHTQIPAVGPLPDSEHLLVGALLWGHPGDAAGVLTLVNDDDLASPHLAAVLKAVRDMVNRGAHPSPQLVMDQLTRGGVQHAVLAALINATTSGAAAGAVREYAAATIAASLRRQVQSGGAALTMAAESADEAELPVIAETITSRITTTGQRLAQLRGETS